MKKPTQVIDVDSEEEAERLIKEIQEAAERSIPYPMLSIMAPPAVWQALARSAVLMHSSCKGCMVKRFANSILESCEGTVEPKAKA